MKTLIRWSTQHRLSAPEFIMGFLGFLTLLLTASTFVFWNTMRPNEQETALFYLPINLLFSCFAWGCAVYHWKTSRDNVRSAIRWIMIVIIIMLHLDTIRGNVDDVSLVTNSNLVMFFLLILLIKHNPLKFSLLYFFISWIFLSITVQLDEDVDLSILPFLGQMMALVLFGIILYSLKNERSEKLLIEEKLSLEQQSGSMSIRRKTAPTLIYFYYHFMHSHRHSYSRACISRWFVTQSYPILTMRDSFVLSKSKYSDITTQNCPRSRVNHFIIHQAWVLMQRVPSLSRS